MKKTQRTDILRNIWKQRVSFLSIIVIAALGITTFLSIDYASYGMKRNGSGYYNRQAFRDIEIVSTMLFNEEDLGSIRDTEGVAHAEAVRETEAKVSFQGTKIGISVMSLTEDVNRLELLEGTLPALSAECVLEEGLVKQLGAKVGDEVSFVDKNGLTATYLKGKTFRVTGIVHHPDHVNLAVTKSWYALVPWDAFDEETLKGTFMKAEILIDREAEPDRFSDGYLSKVRAVVSRLEEIGVPASEKRSKEVYGGAYELIDAGEKKLKEAEKELADARKTLDEKYEEMLRGEGKIEAAEALLAESYPALDEARVQLAAGQLKLEEGRATLDAETAKLNAGKAELERGKAELDSAKAELTSAYLQIENAKDQIRTIIRNAYELAFTEDPAHPLTYWAAVHEPDVDDPAETAGYFWITENVRIDLHRPVEEFFRAAVHASTMPEELLVALYRVTEGTLPPKESGTGAYDMNAVRETLVARATEAAGEYEELRSGCTAWDEGHAKYQAGLRQYEQGLALYEDGKAQIEEAEKQYADGVKQLEAGQKEYEAAKEKYDKSLAEVEDGKKQLAEGRALLEDGEAQYADGLAKFKKGAAEFAEEKAKVDELDPCRWMVFDPMGNTGFVQISLGADQFAKLKTTFSLMFILVGALVIFATVGKMVDEQRRLVGTTKALGFFNREIFSKYLLFGVLATAIGTVLGALAARFFIEPFLLNTFSTFYAFQMSKSYFHVLPTILAFLAGMALAAFSVWLACTRLLREPAVRLMQDKAPDVRNDNVRKGRKVLSLYSRLILLNMRNDLKRVLVTIVSVAGSAGLIIVGFTLRHAVNGSVEKQFNEIVQYDMGVAFDSDTSADAEETIRTILKEAGTSETAVEKEIVTYRFTDIQVAEIWVGNINEIREKVLLNDWITGKPVYATNEGVIIPRRFAESYGLEVGSEFEIILGGLKSGKVRVGAIEENYIGRVLVMSPQYFETVFGRASKPNLFLVSLSGADGAALTSKLEEVKGYESIVRSDSDRDLIDGTTSSVTTTVLLFILIAGLMAAVVQLNLTNMYVLQKKRELTIMRVNGFTVKEVIQYMIREVFLTTAIGIVLGIALGTGVGYSIVRTLEQTFMQFDRSPAFVSWAIAAGLTILFTVIVNWIALRKVKNLKLTDVA